MIARGGARPGSGPKIKYGAALESRITVTLEPGHREELNRQAQKHHTTPTHMAREWILLGLRRLTKG